MPASALAEATEELAEVQVQQTLDVTETENEEQTQTEGAEASEETSTETIETEDASITEEPNELQESLEEASDPIIPSDQTNTDKIIEEVVGDDITPDESTDGQVDLSDSQQNISENAGDKTAVSDSDQVQAAISDTVADQDETSASVIEHAETTNEPAVGATNINNSVDADISGELITASSNLDGQAQAQLHAAKVASQVAVSTTADDSVASDNQDAIMITLNANGGYFGDDPNETVRVYQISDLTEENWSGGRMAGPSIRGHSSLISARPIRSSMTTPPRV